jgi:cell division septal protein FtsQ
LGWNSGGVTYALDAGGKIIGLLSEVGSNVPVVTDSTNLPVKVGDTVAPARFVTFSTTLATNLPKETGIAISSLRVTDTTSELYVVTNKGYQLKLDTTRGVEEQLADLKQVLATLSTQKKTPAEYIDLRIANKAYWK